MKKMFTSFLVGSFCLGFFGQCASPLFEKAETMVSSNASVRELQFKIMQEILTLAQDEEVRRFILSECLKQKRGEYDVFVKDIIESYREVERFRGPVSRLENLVRLIKPKQDDNEPIVFYPRAETIEDDIVANPRARIADLELGEPIGVLQADADSVMAGPGPATGRLASDGQPAPPPVEPWDPSLPGYQYESNGVWIATTTVSEEFAWENDVFVIGSDENVEKYGELLRTEGGPEYAGLIQVTNLNSIEHWTSGKLEMKVVIHSATGIEISNKSFPKVKRKYFRDQAWYDYNTFVANWNTPVIGAYMIENWWEKDGGGTSSSTISQPASNGFPAFSYTINYGKMTII
ncbi:hypothetical protein [Dyadobacter sp. MSC1_007]|jgi:hypothetical protein|uniref:hypothetical protein n=1 Tax=Dyadobacter sp. MSC1_007 TaxID=2909264 RepID=UPI0020301408|nr:hypothetical protein [Dyadobacter sp. MSC1_007]